VTQPSKKTKKKAPPKHYEKPLSLHPMRFVDAVDVLLATKPAKKPKRKAR
jgi:hypothetical protein